MVAINDYECSYENKWCPGCGNFDILDSMKTAFVDLSIPPDKLLIVSGIGQAAKTPHFLKCNMFHALHGRALPLATGAKIVNNDLTIVVNSGDGDCYGEGGNHFMSAVRRNIDLTILVHDNKVYGLTKGQASPTTDPGVITKHQPYGVVVAPFNPLAVALSLGAGFVARGSSGNKPQLAHLIREGMRYKGFALINILQPCVSFNRTNTFAWYKKRVYDLQDKGHDPEDFQRALDLSFQWGDSIPTGILYKKQKPSYTESIGALKDGSIMNRGYDAEKVNSLLSEL